MRLLNSTQVFDPEGMVPKKMSYAAFEPSIQDKVPPL